MRRNLLWNNYSTSIFFMVVFLMLGLRAHATEWKMIYGQEGEADYGEAMQRTAEGGYVIAGTTFLSGVTPDSDVYLIKTNGTGAEEWTRTVGLPNHIENACDVMQTSDGGYILAGTSYLSGVTINPNIYLHKTDAMGYETWHELFGDTGTPTGFSGYGSAVLQTSDGGYIVTGTAYLSGVTIDTDVFLLKTDAFGGLDWSRTLGSDVSTRGYAVQQTIDGGYAISGAAFVSGASFDPDVCLIKTDDAGAPLWTQYFGDAGYDDHGYDLLQADDGDYVIAGTSYLSGATSDSDVIWIRTDPDGNLDGYQIYGDPGYTDTGHAVQSTDDGGYVIAGTTSASGVTTEVDAHIIKTDADGFWEWRRFISGMDNDYAKAVQQAEDGGYVIAGTTFASGTTNDPDIFMLYSQPLTDGSICPNPFDLDSDDDGIPDDEEDANLNGIVDDDETDPCNIDTDGDGIQDGTESGITRDHVGPDTDLDRFQPDEDTSTETDPTNNDSDGDGLSDGLEDLNHNGSQDTGETDPRDRDSDDDAMPDGWEVVNGLNPLIDDADGDADGDLFTNYMEYLRWTDPTDDDDHPSVSDGFDADLDVDGVDLYRFVSGLNSGVLTLADLHSFAEGFGR